MSAPDPNANAQDVERALDDFDWDTDIEPTDEAVKKAWIIAPLFPRESRTIGALQIVRAIREALERATRELEEQREAVKHLCSKRALESEVAMRKESNRALAESQAHAERLRAELAAAMQYGIELGTADPAWVAEARAALAASPSQSLAEIERRVWESAAQVADERIAACRKDWSEIGEGHHDRTCERCHEAEVIAAALRERAKEAILPAEPTSEKEAKK